MPILRTSRQSRRINQLLRRYRAYLVRCSRISDQHFHSVYFFIFVYLNYFFPTLVFMCSGNVNHRNSLPRYPRDGFRLLKIRPNSVMFEPEPATNAYTHAYNLEQLCFIVMMNIIAHPTNVVSSSTGSFRFSSDVDFLLAANVVHVVVAGECSVALQVYTIANCKFLPSFPPRNSTETLVF